MSDAKSKIAKALMKDPEWEYGSILPIATRGPRKSEGETYGDVSLALPDIIRDPLASWTKIRDQNFTNYDMADVLNIMPIPGAAGAAAVPRGALGMMGTKMGKAALDMSPEARLARAAEQGFDTNNVWYRGTNADEVSLGGRGGGRGGGTWIAKDPNYANGFAGGDGGRVMPLRLKPSEIAPAEMMLSPEEAIRAGFKGRYFGDGTAQIFDTSLIRSVNAAFDPANAGKNGLLLEGSGPISAIAAALNGQEDRR